MPLFKVTAKTTEYSHLIVEAPTAEDAFNHAQITDGGDFTPDTSLRRGSWTIDPEVKQLEQNNEPLTLNDVQQVPFDEDQPVTCPECGASTDFENIADGEAELHSCLNHDDCGFVFVVEYETEQAFNDRCCDPA